MHVISRKRLLEAAASHGDLYGPLDAWYRIVKSSDWRCLDDVRRVFPKADGVGKHTVFNIKGNEFRLIAEINYSRPASKNRDTTGRVYIRYVLTHAEYDKGGWRL